MAGAVASNAASLQSMLQTAVQSVHWTYSLFWQFCPRQGVLVWRDGYYNGAIKTRKTVQATEVTAEEASEQRSQQLRELYDSLSTGDANPRRPTAALSPEDLTESEWFYLMCVSFSFPPGTGIPGKAYLKRQHVWLTGANEVESKVFSRAILAKSAYIQTVVCIPVLDGVVELGTTHKVREDLGLIREVKKLFMIEDRYGPRQALSEHSTSNPLPNPCMTMEEGENVEEEEDEDEEEEEESEDEEEGRVGMAESTEVMQVDMSEAIRVGSPDDCSNNLDSNFHLLAVTQHPDILPSSSPYIFTNPPPLSDQLDEELCGGGEEDSRYSQTVSTVLYHQIQSSSLSSTICASSSAAFSRWSPRLLSVDVTVRPPPQYLIKHVLFSVPFLYNATIRDADDQISPIGDGSAPRLRRGGASQEDLSANHVLAERRRREKLNERFIVLRSLVPFVTKMDKASILGDAIEYVKQLRRQIEDLEARERRSVSRSRDLDRRIGSSVNRSCPGSEKRKVRVVEGNGGKPSTMIESPVPMTVIAADSAFAGGSGNTVEVSIIECDALLELRCAYKEGLLLDIMHVLRELGVETTSVQSSLNDGVFSAELRAKVRKENGDGKRVSIVEVKKAIRQIIPHGF